MAAVTAKIENLKYMNAPRRLDALQNFFYGSME